MLTPLPASLQNSHQNGGRVFLIFVANPRTKRLCSSVSRMYSEAVVPQTGRRSADVRCRTIRKLVLCAAYPAPRRSSAPCDQAGTCCVHSPARQIDAYTELERNLFIRRLPPGEQLGGFERDEKL